MKKLTGVVIVALAFAACHARGQFISKTGQSRAVAQADPVQYLFPEQVTLPAGKAAAVALHFRVAPGLHIQSHQPGNEFFIPTVFSIPSGTGVKLVNAAYPPGTNMRLPADPAEPLNVYTGDFVIHARLVASRGNHLVRAKLRYQACDNTQCMPPKTIPVAVDVIGN